MLDLIQVKDINRLPTLACFIRSVTSVATCVSGRRLVFEPQLTEDHLQSGHQESFDQPRRQKRQADRSSR